MEWVSTFLYAFCLGLKRLIRFFLSSGLSFPTTSVNHPLSTGPSSQIIIHPPPLSYLHYLLKKFFFPLAVSFSTNENERRRSGGEN